MTSAKEKGNRASLPPKRVVVVGGGIAGLTAAQELAERGYEVEVIEATPDPYHPNKPRIGGLARTSWAQLPPSTRTAPYLGKPLTSPTQPEPDECFETSGGSLVQRLHADPGPLPKLLTPDQIRSGSTEGMPGPGEVVALVATTDDPRAPQAPTVLDALGESPTRPWIENNLRGRRYTLEVLQTTKEGAGYLQVGRAQERVPGEHGFRFFPAFYSHMLDTMRRIPLPEAAITAATLPGTVLQADSSRTVLDNLVEGTAMELGYRPGRRGAPRTFGVPRTPLRSPEALRRLAANALENAGYRGADVARLLTRYLEYMTSCSERRMDYENESWADFLELREPGKYTSYFQVGIDGGAQALVAMSTTKNDARTIGSVAVQLTLDEVRKEPHSDGILNGPTTVALFEPWQSYLQSIGVRFTLGRLRGFDVVGMAVRPSFQAAEDVAPADYYVMAIPLVDFKAAAMSNGASAERALRDANKDCLQLEKPVADALAGEEEDDIAKYLNFAFNDADTSPDAGPLRNMCGIQFYFAPEIKLLEGHAICVDSAWGVCFVSQVQYWEGRQRGGNGVRGVISATFTHFEKLAPGRDGTLKKAIDCTPAELAERVWLQIADTWNAREHGPLPEPRFFYVDENLIYDSTRTPRWHNATPYLVNDIGTWQGRGGVRTKDGGYAYQMQLGHTVFAGTFMRTRTRLNTMEAANETGRRAANAILAYDHNDAPPCTLWNMEDRELPELRALRDLDRRIHRRGGKHLMRSSTLESLFAMLPWDLARLTLPAYADVADE